MKQAQQTGVVFALFFVSGASGLIDEVVWFRLLSLSFGVSVYAASAVLTAFMGGLALGSWAFGRITARLTQRHKSEATATALLRLFALLLMGVALFAFATPALFSSLTNLYVWIAHRLQPEPFAYHAARTALATLALVPPTFLMGGTLPLLAHLLAVRHRDHGRRLGALYAINTFGGVLGALAAGLVLIPSLGVSGSLYLGGALDLTAAGVAFWLARTWREAPLDPAATPQPAASAPTPTPRHASRPLAQRASGGRAVVAVQAMGASATDAPAAHNGAIATTAMPSASKRALPLPTPARLALIGYTLSGFAALGYQVVWTRTLAIFSLNAVYSFTIMLVTFLIGLAVGSAWMGRRIDRYEQPLALFGWLQIGIGMSAVIALYAFARMPTLLDIFTARTGFLASLWAEFFAAAVIMMMPTLLMGAVFPVAARLYATPPDTDNPVAPDRGGVGARVGRLYALNTVGATLGAFMAGFVFIPLIGLQHSSLLLAMLNLALGAGATLRASPTLGERLRLAGVTGATLLAAALLPPGVYLGFREGVIPELVYYREGVDATVAVFEVKYPPLKMSFVNGRNEVPTDKHSMRAFHVLGHLPALLRPDAQNALMIGFGNGIASGAMATHPLPRIHAVELVAEQVEAARLYEAENRSVLDRPGFQITIEDGRNYLLRSAERYDIITADATHPINSSSWALFTFEFYTMVKSRLTDDGVFVQWLPFHDLSERDYRDIVCTFQRVFPHTTLWYTGATHSFLVATPRPLTRDQVLALDVQLRQSAAGADLGDGRLLAADLIMHEEEVAAFAANGRIVRDDRAFFIPAMDRERILAALEPYARAAARDAGR
ncbi:fused MFS/spermidine synthase [Roseiflexus castenholzii]|uniref:Spermine synthase n=1 Tax=Roseiflexus castenholzii (strain DSM 13941 / HLO8) TaxID=383372 RepID=A7NGQ4_ROSCS|nr:fused MFS/spermidine synthase [Roseiflexus castenholzii]ABU56647.1 Spermine synthase [Roseiflexus castenholzii DSM 13941]